MPLEVDGMGVVASIPAMDNPVPVPRQSSSADIRANDAPSPLPDECSTTAGPGRIHAIAHESHSVAVVNDEEPGAPEGSLPVSRGGSESTMPSEQEDAMGQGAHPALHTNNMPDCSPSDAAMSERMESTPTVTVLTATQVDVDAQTKVLADDLHCHVSGRAKTSKERQKTSC
ncbi:hypothetical protein L227DRAFT_618141 [Lentinus tigrinus ALCF2SS1-6]|uniref:Uncharacterized protein n=1 Tax=Lentinus tigrinus ALCF2SS1-6 TaxID=1328759 RepID=A0A5C2RNF8_9APHY|nr:hypothetical protein L227DRAFT_618141 [Lentinus tigrinus ALCF2SS1-6]